MRRVTVWTAVVLGAVLVCTGCSRPDLETDRAASLQESVLAVTQAAGEARWADAQTLLLTTRTSLDDGLDAGEVSATRYREIDTALDLVATELAAAQAAADQAAAEQAAAAQAAAEQAAADKAAADKAAADKAAAEKNAPTAPKQPPAPKDKGKGGK